jgi:hypothetical protein
VTYQQLTENLLPGQPLQHVDGYTLFAGFLWWSIVVIPVSLVGLLFRRATPSSAVHSVARPRRIGLLEISLVAGFLVIVWLAVTHQNKEHLSQPAQPTLNAGDQFAISVSGDLFPIVRGTTNLPDGAELFVMLKKPWLPDGAQRLTRGLAACGDDCLPATANRSLGTIVTVRQGIFVAGPFSFNGAPFRPGAYPLEISLSPDLRTAPIEQIQKQFGTLVFTATVQVPGNQETYRTTANAPLNLLPTEGKASRPLPPRPAQPQTPQNAGSTAVSSLSPGEIDPLRARISACWSPPPGIDANSKLYVVLRVLFKTNGSLASDPVVIEGSSSPLGPALAESAKRALSLCQPFTMLRPEHYDQWKDLELRFDPHQLLGG